jgi:maleate cis-trans isomerase
MLLGFKGEAELLKKWEKEYKLPFFTSGSNHVRALRALKAKKIVGATYFVGGINDLFAKYFVEAGFDVLGMEGMKVDFDKVGQLSAEQVYAHVKQAFLKHRKADAIYLLGTGWRVLPIIDLLEQDLGRAGRASGAGTLLGDATAALGEAAGQGLWAALGGDDDGIAPFVPA